MDIKKIFVGRQRVGSRLTWRLGGFLLLWLAAFGLAVATVAAEPTPPDPRTMSDTDLLAAVRQLTEQKVGLTKSAQPKLTGKAKAFAERFAALAVQGDTRMNDLAAAGVSTAANASSPTVPDEVGAVQGLEGPALNAGYVKSMLDLSCLLLPLFEQMNERAKNAKLKAFGHESMEAERKQIKELEALNPPP